MLNNKTKPVSWIETGSLIYENGLNLIILRLNQAQLMEFGLQ